MNAPTEWPRPSMLRLYWLATVGSLLVWSGLCLCAGIVLGRAINAAEVEQANTDAFAAKVERDDLLQIASDCLDDGGEMIQYIEKPTTIEAQAWKAVKHGAAVGEGDDIEAPGTTCVPMTEVPLVPVYEGTTL